jgi:hypothetical protein
MDILSFYPIPAGIPRPGWPGIAAGIANLTSEIYYTYGSVAGPVV